MNAQTGHPPSEHPHAVEKTLLERLGPGLITGASDDDPSGIATYSQAGAAYGFTLLWTMVFSWPLMCAIQEISARIGRVTGRGIAGNIRRYYSAWLLYPVVVLLVLANTINLGADIGAMGSAMQLLIGGPALLYAIGFAMLCLVLEVFVSYQRYSRYLKWLTLVLFSYVLAAFSVKIPWRTVAMGTLIPTFSRNGQYWATVVAILGTTISPYLFFWQASQETEEIRDHSDESALAREPTQARVQFGRIRFDTATGMFLSNTVAFFIILAAGATLHAHGITDVQTADQAAEALRPLAGRFAFTLFALGIIGTGLLAVPVLAGSAAYAIGEALRWRTGLDRKPLEAKGFYAGTDGGHLDRPGHQLSGSATSDPCDADEGSVHLRDHQRSRRCSDHGRRDVDGQQWEGHGAVQDTARNAAEHRLGSHHRHAPGHHRNVPHVENLG